MLLGADGHPASIVTVVRGAVWLTAVLLIVLIARFILHRLRAWRAA